MKQKLIKGLEGVSAAESSICYINGEKGILAYRGYAIEELVNKSSFEEVIYLLLEGNIPNKKELVKFKKSLSAHMNLPSAIKKIIYGFPKDEDYMSILRTVVSMLSAYDKESEDMSIHANKNKAIKIMAKMPVIVAAIQRVKSGKIINPKKGLSFAANFLYMLNNKVPSHEDEKMMDIALILHAEHGFNASTFAGRVAVSTLSDIYSGVVSAISTLKGPLHGGANIKAIKSLHEFAKNLNIKDNLDENSLRKIDEKVKNILLKKQRIMGIGHRVYKVKDPRAIILESYAKDLRKKYFKYYKIAKEIESYMLKEKNMHANVDFFSGIVYENLGIKPELYTCIFALSRTSGWLSHIFEQYSDNRLIRPKAIYVGSLNKKYPRR